jgi:hypothetical protein
MKQLVPLLVLVALIATAQTNTTPEQAASLAQQAETERQRQVLIEQTEIANQKAEANRKALAEWKTAHPEVTGFGETNKLELIPAYVPKSRPADTNIIFPGFGDILKECEKWEPGISTNFTPAQRAATNGPGHKIRYRKGTDPAFSPSR